MKFTKTDISNTFIIEPPVFTDARGTFIKNFNYDDFSNQELHFDIKETYYSDSMKNVIRGMHFQTPPFDHDKLVYVTSGRILDVILDIRISSPTFGKFITVKLTENNNKCVYIGKGCAHGFLSLCDNTRVMYMQTSVYSQEHDAGIRWDSFGMDWEADSPILSARDKSFPALKDFNSPFTF
jgi:dTDP-4-dehydrorhamnose 3,5-epimerase